MRENVVEYKKTMTRIGGALLVFVGLFYLTGSINSLIEPYVYAHIPYASAYTLMSLIGSAAYLISFLVPAAFFYLISGRKGAISPYFEARLDRHFPLMLIASIAVVLATAIANSYIVSPFGFGKFMQDIMSGEPIDSNYKLILSLISTALVPACCEEVLFRSTILTNLLPYGKANAILVSAVLFGLMHQNPAQMFYATAAGIVIGLVYVRTKSIWGGTLIHFFNNLISVVEQMLFDNLAESTAYTAIYIMEGAIFALGLVCAVILIVAERKRTLDFSESGFGVIYEADEDYIERPLGKGEAVKGFFNPTVTIFTIISCIVMAGLIAMSMITAF